MSRKFDHPDRSIDHNGSCITGCVVDETVAPHAVDEGNAEKLWALSEKLVGEEFRYS